MGFIKYYLLNLKETLFLGIVVIIISSIGCYVSTVSNSNSNTVKSSDSKCKNIEINEKPNGKELQINAERISDNKFLIKVKNISNRKVFSAFELGINILDSSLPYITEKRNQNGEFITDFAGHDYAPLLRPIEPNQEIGFQFFEIEKGDYRLKFRYLVDENLARLLNSRDCLFKFSYSDTERIAEADLQVITPILTINKNIHKKN